MDSSNLLLHGKQVSDMGSRALAVSLPFACVLGLLSSLIASTMGKNNFFYYIISVNLSLYNRFK